MSDEVSESVSQLFNQLVNHFLSPKQSIIMFVWEHSSYRIHRPGEVYIGKLPYPPRRPRYLQPEIIFGCFTRPMCSLSLLFPYLSSFLGERSQMIFSRGTFSNSLWYFSSIPLTCFARRDTTTVIKLIFLNPHCFYGRPGLRLLSYPISSSSVSGSGS